jgi:transglutaminase-like putative cysteine protease
VWRTYEVTTRVELKRSADRQRAWVPLPSVDNDWQQVVDVAWTTNAVASRIETDGRYGARILSAEFAPGVAVPSLEAVCTVRTQSRAKDWSRREPQSLDAASRQFWTRPTKLIRTDGLVGETARKITAGCRDDEARVRAVFDWVVNNTYREPKVRGCGTGDIHAMLETGNLGGKCGDINALFVGLCRAAGVPARDVYGIRVAPSAFGYKELGAGPNITRAQHCRAEVFLAAHGWVAMDPADVGKVMRLETPTWLRDVRHEVVAPVYRHLYGGWEGNWLAYNTAHDLSLPGSRGPSLGFFMYPNAENELERFDELDPDALRYSLSARELRI